MADIKQISDQELWEYIDGGLSRARREQIAATLAENPEQAAQAEAMRQQNERLKALGQDIIAGPVPDKLKKLFETAGDNSLSQSSRIAPGNNFMAFGRTGSSVISIAVGFAIGWLVHSSLQPQPTSPIQDALSYISSTYDFYSGQNDLPLDFLPERRADMEERIAKLFGRSIALPDLSPRGYQYRGARIIPASIGNVAIYQFDVADKNSPVAVIFWPSEDPPSELSNFTGSENKQIRYWTVKGYGFAVASNAAPDIVDGLSQDVYQFYQAAFSETP